MKRARDFRKSAWDAMRGKWGTLALIFLVYALITGALSSAGALIPSLNTLSENGVSPLFSIVSSVLSIVSMLITGPFLLSIAIISLKVIKGLDVAVENLFSGFKDYSRSMVLYIVNDLLIFFWSLLFIIPGIIKSLSYSMSFYILAENPNISTDEARKRSMELMHGNKWRLFCLYCSFLGWMLLCVLTLGILYFWIYPYIETAKADFYRTLCPEQGEVETPKLPGLSNMKINLTSDPFAYSDSDDPFDFHDDGSNEITSAEASDGGSEIPKETTDTTSDPSDEIASDSGDEASDPAENAGKEPSTDDSGLGDDDDPFAEDLE